MKHDGRLTDAPGYAATVRRRKMLTEMINRAAERSDQRRHRYRTHKWKDEGCAPAAPVGATTEEFLAFVEWEEAWINAIREERKCLNPTQYKAQKQNPMPLRYSPAALRPKRSRSGATP